MSERKKAYIVIPWWADDQNIEANKHKGSTPIYAESAGKAKYKHYISHVYKDRQWFKNRALRWPEQDVLFAQPLDINL